MKYFVACLTLGFLALVSHIACAATATLDAQACAPGLCYNVQNDADVKISYIGWGTSSLEISLNGTTIYSRGYVYPTKTTVPGPNGSTITTYVFEDVVLEEFFGGTSGATVTLSIVWTEVDKPCSRQGKVTICPRTVTLVDGTLVTP